MSEIRSFRGAYSFLSNFHPCEVTVGGFTAPSVEHAYQALKTRSPEEARWVLSSPSPAVARRRGRQVTLRSDWAEVQLSLMEQALRAKFEPGSDLGALLLETGDAELVEGNSWNDTFWGVCRGRGKNHLGRLLMQIRAELRDFAVSPPLSPPPAQAERSKTISAAVTKLTIGAPTSHGNLTLLPLLASTDTLPDYVPLAEALRGGAARVTEVSSGGSVPELLLDNGSDRRVLLLDGDELVGAKQNRVLNITILVGARTKVVIPVSCVERGRWHARSAEFTTEDRMMFAKGRARKMASVSRSMRESGSRRSDQGDVWRSVGEKVTLFQAAAPTEAMSDVYEHTKRDIGQYRGAFRPLPRQVGAIFAIDGQPAGLELFDAPATFASTLGRLVESYAMDAIESTRRDPPAPTPDAVTRFLSRALSAKSTTVKAVGEGEDVRLEAPGIVGQALVVGERLVHLSALVSVPSVH